MIPNPATLKFSAPARLLASFFAMALPFAAAEAVQAAAARIWEILAFRLDSLGPSGTLEELEGEICGYRTDGSDTCGLDLDEQVSLCEHFAETCVHAEGGGRTVGFISAYRPPQRGDVIFVWQVAVAEEVRGQGLARAMLRELLARPAVCDCRYLETTVSPSNEPSRGLFHGLARECGAAITERVLFAEPDFGAEPHEAETLIRIGPFAGA